MKHLLLGASALALTLGTAGTAAAQSEGEFTLNILHINDLHSRIESINAFDSTCGTEDEEAGECFGGIARVKTAIDTRRDALTEAGENVIVLDAGDQYQGSLFYTTYKGDEVVEFMNMIGFDAMAVGNHEFDDGPEGLAVLLDGLDFPIISGNTDVTEDATLAGRLPGAVVLEVGGEKIGIVSVLAEDTAETSSPGAGVRFIQAEDYLMGAVQGLEAAGINKIIALTHMGVTRDIDIASAVPGIDVIVGGHSHTLFSNTEEAEYSYPFMVENPAGVEVPIVQAYAYSKYLGELSVTFDADGNVVSAEGDPLLLDASIEPDADAAARVTELKAPIEELMQQVVGTATDEIDGSRETCRIEECEMGNLVADAILDRVADQGVQLVIQNGGGLRASIDAGEITMGEVITVLPFQNTLATFELDGAGIREALENGVSDWENGAGRFPQVAGIRYTWERDAAVGERIVSVDVMQDGEWMPLEDDTVYKVATNNYMRNGGDGYAMFAGDDKNAYDFGPGLEIVLADYIAELGGEYTPYLDGRISEVE
ncbi:bifunctional metallophosphatase/5'-nucleotidase [Pelagibacterium xiamenense]|uniref:bifunctional metallophosphatase/5'-nucleotidase n=1 Tax=Pelagibacterium xiamenense TaxID=2901140 RepID=UPI001E50F028|nr:bifunctional metallophosphatase/5'-nucleotidase [Pelagibacterium xiamenense]MCD7060374.1 5'-nucleotidase/apyrase family protein [Pelagibacterium xiamenense]